MPELTQSQIAILERLRARGFQIVAHPMYANHVGIRKANCAALLAPSLTGGLEVFGAPCYIVAGNLGVPVIKDGKRWFIWKKEKVEATPARLAKLEQFAAELAESLLPAT